MQGYLHQAISNCLVKLIAQVIGLAAQLHSKQQIVALTAVAGPNLGVVAWRHETDKRVRMHAAIDHRNDCLTKS